MSAQTIYKLNDLIDTLDVLNRDEDEEEFIEYEDGCELYACC